MGMDTNIVGGVSNAKAEVVSQDSGDNGLAVALSDNPGDAGFAALAVEMAGAAEPATKTIRRLKASLNRRLAVGMDTPVMEECFVANGAQNTGLWKNAVTTFTFSFATSGFVVFNSGSVTTSGAAQLLQSYQHIVLGGQKPVIVDVPFIITAAPPSNWQMDFGLASSPSGSSPFAMADGVYLRINSTGLYLVMNYAGTETVSGLLIAAASLTPNVCLTARIVIGSERTEVWLTNPSLNLGEWEAGAFAMLGGLDTPSGNPYPCAWLSLPFSARLFHSAAAGAAVQFKLGGMCITEGDVGQNRSWERMLSRMGMNGAQGQNGGTMGSTALLTNSLAAGAGAAMTNTTAALGSGLGGQFAAQPTLAAGTDGILCSYSNVLPTVGTQPRTLMIDGIRIQGLVTTAFTGGPVLYAYSLAFGQTAVSLATAEAIAAKAPRRIALGFETYVVTAAVGVLGQGVQIQFKNPIVVNPGEAVAVVAKNLGTVTSAGVICFLVTFDSHWE